MITSTARGLVTAQITLRQAMMRTDVVMKPRWRLPHKPSYSVPLSVSCRVRVYRRAYPLSRCSKKTDVMLLQSKEQKRRYFLQSGVPATALLAEIRPRALCASKNNPGHGIVQMVEPVA